MKKRILAAILALLLALLCSCSTQNNGSAETTAAATTVYETTHPAETTAEVTTTEPETTKAPSVKVPLTRISADESIRSIGSGLSVAKHRGDYGFSDFLSEGGAASDRELSDFLVKTVILSNLKRFSFGFGAGGCSTISACGENGSFFGRNYDWKSCNGLILVTEPSDGYRSVSTVNMDYITSYSDYNLTDDMMRMVAAYSPLDGMNEKGVCISVNTVNGGEGISQNTGKKDLTTATAIRLVLDRAATASEAVNLLKNYDMHISLGQSVHFAITDASGGAVAVEYVGNKMLVTETPVLTNHYVYKGSGKGTSETYTRESILRNLLSENGSMNQWEVRDALKRVCREGGSLPTQWSAVFDRRALSVTYYPRCNFSKGYILYL